MGIHAADRELLQRPEAQALVHGNTSNHYHKRHHHHDRPINVPTAGAQAFLMDYPQGEGAITHHAGSVRIGGCLVRIMNVA
jgi:hypothetical protein